MRTLILLLLVGVSTLAQMPMPQFLKVRGDANCLPETVREKMVLAEARIGEAEAKYRVWSSSEPNPGYTSYVEKRRLEFLNARAAAFEAVKNAVDCAENLQAYPRSVVSGWAKRSKKKLGFRGHSHNRAFHARFFSEIYLE
jgi:hypothetical protein